MGVKSEKMWRKNIKGNMGGWKEKLRMFNHMQLTSLLLLTTGCHLLICVDVSLYATARCICMGKKFK